MVEEKEQEQKEENEDFIRLNIPIRRWLNKFFVFLKLVWRFILNILSHPMKFWKFLKKHPIGLNVASNLLLFFATLLLIIVTIFSTSVALYYSAEAQRQGILSELNLAEDLKVEIIGNMEFIQGSILKLDEIRNTSEGKHDRLLLTSAKRAKDMGFGTEKTKLILNNYIGVIDYLKKLLSEIEGATENRQWDVQNKNIDNAIPTGTALINDNYGGISMSYLIDDIDLNINKSRANLDEMDKRMKKRLFKLLNLVP